MCLKQLCLYCLSSLSLRFVLYLDSKYKRGGIKEILKRFIVVKRNLPLPFLYLQAIISRAELYCSGCPIHWLPTRQRILVQVIAQFHLPLGCYVIKIISGYSLEHFFFTGNCKNIKAGKQKKKNITCLLFYCERLLIMNKLLI